MLTKEEARYLKIYLKRTNASKSRKDILLFDLVKKMGDRYDEDSLQMLLYGHKDKNALYRLKNRLLDDIGKSLSLQYHNSIPSHTVMHSLELSRLFKERSNYDIALYYLKKAEKKASELQNFELLDIIYSDFIKLSHDSLLINPEQYIEKRKLNREQLNIIREIDDILAALIYRIRLSQNFSPQNYKIIEVLQKTIDEFSQSDVIRSNPQLRFKIYHAVSRILLQQHDYKSLEDYLLLTLEEFTNEGLFNRNNHDTKLQLLTYLTNALHKNRKLKESLDVAKELEKAMDEYGGFLKEKYRFYYHNALINNYSVLDNDKAIECIDRALKDAAVIKVPMNKMFLFLQMAILYFGKREFKRANKYLVRLKLENSYGHLDAAFKLKICMVEMIVRYEMGDLDFIEHQLKQMKREFADLLGESMFSVESELLWMLGEMTGNGNWQQNKNLLNRMRDIVKKTQGKEYADTEIINYQAWLTSKLSALKKH